MSKGENGRRKSVCWWGKQGKGEVGLGEVQYAGFSQVP